MSAKREPSFHWSAISLSPRSYPLGPSFDLFLSLFLFLLLFFPKMVKAHFLPVAEQQQRLWMGPPPPKDLAVPVWSPKQTRGSAACRLEVGGLPASRVDGVPRQLHASSSRDASLLTSTC